ncbi:MAG: glycerophosphodiester phosphodiesterase family protein, partial [Eubacteriales bacterium]
MKQKLLAVLVALVMTVSLSVTAFAAPEDETVEAATTTTRVTTSKDTSDEAIARATAEGGEDEEDETRAVDEIITSYNNNNGRVLSAARAGYPRLYPEDSLTGLRYCVESGVDIISVTVQQTKDKGLVLLEDATIDRMLVDRSTGEAGKGKVSSYTLEELQNNFYLRDGHGGSKKATKETVPGLHD